MQQSPIDLCPGLIGWGTNENREQMKYLRNFNMWPLLPALFVAKIWAAIDKGVMGPLLLLMMATLSLLLLLHSERDTTMRSVGWQGAVYIAYITLVLLVFFAMGLREKELAFLKSLIPYNLWPTFLIDAFGAAVLEEIIFRKFLLRSLLKRMGRSYAVILSSLIFYLFHFSIMVTIMISGIFYASATLRWNSLLLAIGVHTLYDFLGNMAVSVDQASSPLVGGLNAHQVLHGGNALSHFLFIAVYFAMIFIFDIIVACIVKIKSRRKKLEEIASCP